MFQSGKDKEIKNKYGAPVKCVVGDNIKNLIVVEYPGFVENVDAAIETLSGLDKTVRQNLNQKQNLLQIEQRDAITRIHDRVLLTPRPKDRHAHSIRGDSYPTKCLLIKFKRKKLPDGENYDFSAEVVGKIETKISFKSLADFQWLPMTRIDEPKDQGSHSVEENEKTGDIPAVYRSVIDESIPRDPFNGEISTFDTRSPLIILPSIFSRFVQPNENISIPEAKKIVNTDKTLIFNSRKVRSKHSLNIDDKDGQSIK